MSHLLPSTVTALPTKTAKTLKTIAKVSTNSAEILSSTSVATIFASFSKEQQILNEPAPKKLRRKRENPQAAAATEDYDSDDSHPMSCSDVESFQGKIVYNPDGSAYIIDSENDSFSNISDNCMSVGTSSGNATTNITIGAANATTATNPNPKIHTFRVVTANDASVNINSEPNRSLKIQKPILMCFICKLSFGNTKSFTLHANSEHALNLQESEKLLLNHEYSSAIIQRNADEKPQVSFLEPLETTVPLPTKTDFAPIVTTTTAEKSTAATVAADSGNSNNKQTKNNDSGSNMSSADEQPNSTSITQQEQLIISVDLLTSSPTATTMPTTTTTQLSPSSSSCTTTTTTTTSINYGSLKTATTKTTTTTAVTTAATADVVVSAAAAPAALESSSSSPQSLAVAATVAGLVGNKTNPCSTDNLSSMYNLRHSTTPIPISTPTYASTTMICNSAPQSPQSTSSAAAAAASSVVDYLQQQLQQHMERITSPAAAATLAVVSTLASNVDNVTDITTTTNTNAAMLQQQQLAPPPSAALAHHSSLSSLHASLAALANDQNSNNVKLINDFFQQQLAAQHHHHQQQQCLNIPTSGGCPEHPDVKGIDCKSCEMLEIQQLKSPLTPQRSPNSSMSGSMLQVSNSLTTSPTTSAVGIVSTTPTAAAATSSSSFTIGACPEHINGRPLGMDCARCEMILNSARLNSGVQMSTRNSCKTLKCPQCNWHYKYQETLEIHMREKHPDGESACGYCLAGQQHPRLARGESYTCGYKPYRCEICNYSTTTKGNLSIHMQSDKHLNNMQELNSTQNMAAAAAAAVAVAASSNQAADASPKMLLSNLATAAQQSAQQQQQQQQHQSSAPSSSTSSTASAANKPKPTFRCDVCSYETSVARNLRIHMTSEKHTHNMAVLQNNIKHIQAFSFLQQQQAAAAAQQQQHQQQQQQQQQMNPLAAAGVLPQLPGSMGSSFLPEAALADLAYNQALMIQLLHQNSAAGALSAAAAAAAASSQQTQQHTPKTHLQISPGSPGATSAGGSCNQPSSSYSPNKSPSAADSSVTELSLAAAAAAGGGGGALSQDALDPSIEPDLRPTTFYSCLVCATYNTNSLDELNQHLLIDRSRQHIASNSSEIMLILNNNYICRLCNYKTNLKANFQLHSKTDKHLQKLNFINHIREGGMRNEYKLKYHQISTNTVQLKCNCCDFYTNSIQKLSLHTQHMRHDTMKIIFQHLLYLIKQGGMLMDKKTSGAIASECNSGDDAGLESEHYNESNNSKALLCQLCNFTSMNLLHMVQHIKSLRHIQVEQFIGLQRRSEGLDSLNLEDVFKISESPVVSHVGCIKSERESPELISAVNDTSTSGCLIESISTRDETSPMNLDNYFFASAGSGSSISKFGASSNISGTGLSPASMPSSSCLPSVIYKCSNCDFFSQSKQEMEHHIDELHPSTTEPDFISIPTNAAAIHAFQAAVVAATAAAAAAATRDQKSPAQKSNQNENDGEDDCPVAIKKERLEPVDTDEDKESSALTHMEVEQPTQETVIEGNISTNVGIATVQCPLCQDDFTEKQLLEMHLMGVHSVSRDGLARLLQLVDTSSWQNVQKMPNILSAAAVAAKSACSNTDVATTEQSTVGTSPASQNVEQTIHTAAAGLLSTGVDIMELNCQQCGSSFKLQQQLLIHAQDTQHYPMQHGEYQCLVSRQCPLLFSSVSSMIAHYKDTHMNLVISERHVYKYRCKQCSLAFKTQEKLATHTLYHTMRDATKCGLCQRNFRSTQSLQKHMDQVHTSGQSQQLPLQSQLPPENTAPLQHAGCKSPMTSPSSSSSMANIADLTIDKTNAAAATLAGRDDAGTSTLDTAQKINSEDSLAMSSVHGDVMETKEPPLDSNTSKTAPQSPALSVPHQHQHVAAIAALLRQQQQRSTDATDRSSPEAVMQQLQMEPAILAQKIMEQNLQQAAVHFPNLTPQNLQSLQNLQNLQQMQQMQQQLPQMAAAAAASGISMNPVDMLNLMQFHHLMSLNFMNLAPPLIFGGSANVAGSTAGTAGVTATASNVSATLGSNVLPTNSNSCMVVGGSNTTSGGAGAPSFASAEGTAAQLLQQQASPAAAAAAAATQISNNQKRARTRITDDQLKILRAHFDINNSPSEESIMEMSKKANLPMKVVKHWFRNTLFKERQRNKDSPYNFNNPPSTTLNLEEYERTGQTKVISLSEPNCTSGNSINSPIITTTSSGIGSGNSSCIQQQQQQQSQLSLQNPRPDSAQSSNAGDFIPNSGHLNFSQQQHEIQRQNNDRPLSHASSVASGSCPLDVQIKSEPTDDVANYDSDQQQPQQQQQQLLTPTSAMLLKHQQLAAIAAAAAANEQQSAELNEHTVMQAAAAIAASAHQHHQQQHHNFYNSYETKSESGSSDILSRPQTPNSASATNPYSSMSDLLGQQLDNLPLNNMSNMNNMGPPKKFQMSKVFEKNSPSSQFETNSNSSNSSSASSGKRANRTRFTDYQIKVLQEFFENNSYPKDSDLEYLSKLLLLSPRVIVVWFQNARQKQRKIYENQPNNSFYETEEKKQNINYACKKCNLVFQRYYELIRHQKNHCFKEENNKKSAKAQIAAAQIAQSLSSEDSNSSMDINNTAATSLLSGHHQQHAAVVAAAAAIAASATTPGLSPSPSLNLLGTSPQHHLFGKASSAGGGCMTVDCSPSTTPTPPQRERSSSIDQQHTKFECEKCQLTFNRYEQFREHQLIHIMNPSLFGGQQQQQTLQSGQQTISSETMADYSPFGGILQSLQQVASAAAANHHQQHEASMDLSRSQHQQQQQEQLKKRKFSDASSPTEEEILGADNCEMQINKKFKSEQYDFLYQYYMQNETNMDLKQSMQAQQQSPDLELEYLSNFYHQTEIKKRSNYDFLFQYYLRNEQQQSQVPPTSFDATNKPNIDFLLQYYQLSESKKFFQLDASPQRIHDCSKAPTSIERDADNNNSNSCVYSLNHRHHSNIINNGNRNNNSNTSSSNHVGDDPHVDHDADNVPEGEDIADDIIIQRSMQHYAKKKQQQQNHVILCDDIDDEHSENAAISDTTDSADNSNNNNNSCNIERTQQSGCEVNQNFNQDEEMHENQNNIHHKTLPTPPPTDSDQRQSPSSVIGNRSNSQFPLGQVNFNNLEDFLDASMIENQTHAAVLLNETLADANAAPTITATATTATRAPTPPTLTSIQPQHTASAEHKQNKRLRTTILPEQLNFLYECYQNESNPSRKMLEEISKKVNLKKRVVQVWYQNSRARERKGQFRQNLQIINKKCPYCTAIFKIKSALEWHLQSKHGDRPKLNINQIADIKITEDQNKSQEIKQQQHRQQYQQQLQMQQQQPQKPLDLSRAQMQQPQTIAAVSSALNTTGIVNFPQEQQQKDQQHQEKQQQETFAVEKDFNAVGKAATNIQNTSHIMQQKFIYDFSPTSTHASRYCNFLKAALISTSSSSSAVSSSSLSSSSSASATTSFSITSALSSSPSSTSYSPRPSSISLPLALASPGLQKKKHKRFRTQMNRAQKRILRELFKDVKTPTMSDCLSIGREIGLQKRVIQVWFQNARAKDKKSRHQRYVSEDSNCDDKTRDCSQAVIKAVELRDCQLCQLQQVNIHQHAFSAEHIGRVKALLARTQLIKTQKYTNGNSGGGSDSLDDQQNHPDENEENKQQQQHQNIGNSKATGVAGVANNAVMHNIFKSNFNQEQSFLIYEKDTDASNASGVADSSNSRKLANNLTLKINGTDNPLDADTANAHAHHSDIIQQLFNCNQMSVDHLLVSQLSQGTTIYQN